MTDNLTQALAMAARGWYVFPCKPDKTPYTPHGFKDATQDPDKIRAFWASWPGALIGIHCERSGFFALDLDHKNGVNGTKSLTELIETHGAGADIPTGPIQKTPSGGFHVLFNLPDNLKIPNNAGKLASGIDLRSAGYICSGGAYAWQPDHGPDTTLTDAPAWLLDLIRNRTEKRPSNPATTAQAERSGANSQNVADYWLTYYLQRAYPGCRNEQGFYLACQLRDSGLTESEAAPIMATFAARVPGEGYNDREALATMQSAYNGAKREAAHLPGLTTRRNGHGPTHEPEPPAAFEGWPTETTQAPAELIPTIPTPGNYKLDDIGNGERLARRHGPNMRFVKEWGWLTWTGKVWELDRGQVAAWAKETARSIYAEAAACEDDTQAATIAKHARATASKNRREAMVDAAISEPGISSDPGTFDRDPWALNVQNGILDLKTGELKPHDQGALLTKIAGTYYDPAARCPKWERFLTEIFNNDQDLINFMQRAAGYSLTGDTSEQVFFFLHGLGANGKSTFAGVLHDLLAAYAMKARAETLMLRKFEPITEETAQIMGVRFMLAAELGKGQRLNEPMIKDLTGGDKLRARRLYRDSFEFYPIAKVWLYGNHKPDIKGTDEGIWRRPQLIPFDVTFPEGKRDKRLPEKLRAELPGVLAWAVRGCLEWQRQGLAAPAIVKAATADFRAEQDIIGQFLAECCITNSLATITSGELYTAYEEWAKEGGIERQLTKIDFSHELAERGYTTKGPDGKPQRQPGTGRAYYMGLGLLEK